MPICELCPTLGKRRGNWRITRRGSHFPMLVCDPKRHKISAREIADQERVPMLPEIRSDATEWAEGSTP